MPGSSDIEFARLVDWVEGRLSEEEARAVEEQVGAAGEETRASVAWLRAFAQISEDVILSSPPPEVHDALVERFEAYAQRKRGPGILERLTAALAFDGGIRPAMGMRSAGAPEAERQLVYSTRIADIALVVRRRPGEERLDLYGQILPRGETEPGSYAVQLLGETEFVTTTVDELGEFVLEALPSGVYEAFVSNQRVEIQIPALELRP